MASASVEPRPGPGGPDRPGSRCVAGKGVPTGLGRRALARPARHDLRLGLHRLRLQGELTEIRAEDLKFTLTEARALLEAAGVDLSGSALALLHERTEGWAAGLRLAALSLAGHPDPERFAAEFSGSEPAVAEYPPGAVPAPPPAPAPGG